MKKNEIRWGIIGCGDVTEVKSGPAFQHAEGSNLVAVMRRNAVLAEDYARRHQVGKWYDRAEALIHDPEVDAVYIATPPSSHREYTLAAAEAGKPVYVEKPMALTYAECLEMIDACERKKIPLFVAYYRRGLPRFLKIKSLLDEGAIGAIRFVTVSFYQKPAQRDLDGIRHWRVDPKIAGCGYFYDLASHMFDILQYFLGDVKSASGYHSNQALRYEAEDMVSCAFIFDNDVHGTGVWNFNSFKNMDLTEIVGERGKITFTTFDESPIQLENSEGFQEFHLKNPPHIQQPLIQTIVNELLGGGRCPSTGRTGATTNWVFDQILRKQIVYGK